MFRHLALALFGPRLYSYIACSCYPRACALWPAVNTSPSVPLPTPRPLRKSQSRKSGSHIACKRTHAAMRRSLHYRFRVQILTDPTIAHHSDGQPPLAESARVLPSVNCNNAKVHSQVSALSHGPADDALVSLREVASANLTAQIAANRRKMPPLTMEERGQSAQTGIIAQSITKHGKRKLRNASSIRLRLPTKATWL